MKPPDWKRYAASGTAFLASAGAVVGTALSAYSAYATNAAASPAAGDALLVSLGVNLLSSGIAALCDRGVFRAKREFQETLANHDIMRLLTAAWGEACHTAVEAYGNSKAGDRNHPPSITSVPPAPEFLELCRKLKAEDFSAGAISIANLEALNESRRALVSVDPNSPEGIQEIDQHAQTLRAAMVDSVISTLTSKPSRLEPNAALPEDFRSFLEGLDPVFPGGILGQLSLRVAFHLKTDERARIAIVHYSLQQIADAQTEASKALKRIETLCDSIAGTLTTSQQQFVSAFEAKIEAQIKASLPNLLDQAFQGMVLPPLEAPFAANGGAQAFTYRMRATAFVGRQAALRELVDFVSDDRPGLWTVITGPTGSGKSRLAAELLAKARRTKEERAGAVAPGEWRAGFLRAGRHWLENEAVRWKPDADTLIVIDYASEFDARILGDFLAHLGRSASDGATTYGCRVRVVLIDRLPADSEFGIATRLVRGKDHGEEIRRSRWVSSRSETPLAASLPANQRISSDPLELAPLDETGAMAVARDWAGDAWTADVESIVRKALREDEELQRPLFAALVGESIRTGGLSTGVLNPVLVANQAIVRLFGEPTGDEVDHAARMILAVATAGQGVPSSIVSRALICRLTGVPSCSNVLLEQVRNRLLSWVTLTSDGWIPPLEPDFLGGLFVLECLSRLDSEAAIDCADSIMDYAWSNGRNPGGFVLRLISNFLRHLGPISRTQHDSGAMLGRSFGLGLVERLIIASLNPWPLTRGGASVVAYAVYVMAESGQTRAARGFLFALEARWHQGVERITPEVVADAWFGFVAAPPSENQSPADEAIEQLQHLLAQYRSERIALRLVQAIVNATVGHTSSIRSRLLVDKLASIRIDFDSREIALAHAMALHNLAANEESHQRCMDAANAIARIREHWDSFEIGLEHAKTIYQAVLHAHDSATRWTLAQLILPIFDSHATSDIALVAAAALRRATEFEPNRELCTSVAESISLILGRQDTTAVALELAQVLNRLATAVDEPETCFRVAGLLASLLQRHNSPQIAFLAVGAFGRAIVVESDPKKSLEIASRIAAIRHLHDRPESALAEAAAFALVAERDAKPQRTTHVDRIAAILQQHNTPEIEEVYRSALDLLK